MQARWEARYSVTGQQRAPASSPVDAEAILLTAAGRQQLQSELNTLRQMTRPFLTGRVRDARLYLEGNAAEGMVGVAERDLATVEERIAEIEATLAKAQIVGEGPAPSTVQPGFPVTVRSGDGSRQTVTIVSSEEANLDRGRISNASPAGKALLGKAPGAAVSVGSGSDAATLTVEKIERPSSTTGVLVPAEEGT